MSDLSIEQRLDALEALHDNFQIVGGSNVTVEGSISHGYAVCSTCPKEGQPTEEGTGGTISPSPSPLPDCPCGFDAFDGSGRRFLTRTWTYFEHQDECCRDSDNATCVALVDSSGSIIHTIDPVTCEETITGTITSFVTWCDGSTHDTNQPEFDPIWDTITDTEETYSHTSSNSCAGCLKPPVDGTIHVTNTLSDECNPI